MFHSMASEVQSLSWHVVSDHNRKLVRTSLIKSIDSNIKLISEGAKPWIIVEIVSVRITHTGSWFMC